MNQKDVAQRYYRVSSWILVSFLMFIAFNPVVSEANPRSWEHLKGSPICGGIVNGRLQAACENKSAKKESKAVGECPKGSFFDIGTWSCFTCPSGYNRTGFHVEKEKACSKNVKDQFAKATYKAKKQCPAGSFLDIRKGGECWSCPGGYGRTASAVDKWNACGKIGKKAVSATFKGKACKDGAFGDPRNGGECWICPEGFQRTARAVTHNNACVKREDFKSANKEAALTCPAGQTFDFIDGGTCWSCPTGYKRTWHSVKSDKACKNVHLDWESPKPRMPGIFGLKGAEAVVIELIKERTQIDEAIKNTATETGNDPGKWKKEAWDKIENAPWESPILATKVLEAAVAAAKKSTSQRSQIEKDLVKSVSDAIQYHRLFVATQAQQAFDNALATSEKEIAEQNNGGMQGLFGGIPTAPDYDQLTQGLLGVSGAGVMGLGVATIIYNPASQAVLLPFRSAARQAAVKAVQKIGVEAAKQVASKSMSMSTLATASAGPLIIITGAILIAQMELDKVMQTEETRGKLRQAIDQAKGKLDLAVFLEKEGGFEEIMYHWAALMDGTTEPSAAFYAAFNADSASQDQTVTTGIQPSTGSSGTNINLTLSDTPDYSDSPANQSIEVTDAATENASKVLWKRIKGSTAKDIAVAADGEVWIVDGKQLYGSAKNLNAKSGKWGDAGTGKSVSKIAAGKKADIWTLGDSVNVKRYAGKDKWKSIYAGGKKLTELSDIAVGPKGHTWAISFTEDKNKNRTYEIVKWSKGAWKSPGDGWKKSYGKPARIAVTAKGNAWVINKKGQIYTGTGKKWKKKLGTAKEIVIGANGRPWALGRKANKSGNHSIYYWKNKKWNQVNGEASSIAVAPDGALWVTKKDGKIFTGIQKAQ